MIEFSALMESGRFTVTMVRRSSLCILTKPGMGFLPQGIALMRMNVARPAPASSYTRLSLRGQGGMDAHVGSSNRRGVRGIARCRVRDRSRDLGSAHGPAELCGQ